MRQWHNGINIVTSRTGSLTSVKEQVRNYSAFKNIHNRQNLFPANKNQPIDLKMAKRKIPKSWAEEIAELDDPAPQGIQVSGLQFSIIRLK